MQNVAYVIIDGNLTTDPQLKKTNSDKSVMNFTVACNHEWNESKSVSFFSVECWDKLAENCGKYLNRGSRITVQGELREDRWLDDDNQRHSRVKIVAKFIRFDYLGNKKDDDKDQENSASEGTESKKKDGKNDKAKIEAIAS